MIELIQVHNDDYMFTICTLTYHTKFVTVCWDKLQQKSSLCGYDIHNIPSVEDMNKIADFCLENF